MAVTYTDQTIVNQICVAVTLRSNAGEAFIGDGNDFIGYRPRICRW